MTAILQRNPALAQFAAEQNAQTIVAQQREYQATIDRLGDEIRRLGSEVSTQRGDIADLRREKRYLSGIVTEMQRTRVTLADGRITTAYAIWENNLGDEMCCADLHCSGCPDTDGPDREVFDVR